MKHFKLSKKSLMSFALSAIMLVSMSSIAMICYAIEWSHPTTNAFNVTLYEDQKRTYSGALVDPCICYEGRNSGTKRTVLFTPQYSTDGQGTWHYYTMDVRPIEPQRYLSKQVSTYDANKPWWRLCIENKALGSGATAYGWCW